MLDRIIRFSLDNRLFILVLAFLILAGGMVTLFKTEVDIFPDLNAPTVVVMTESPGMAPEEVEQLVTFPIEATMNGAPGVRRVRSSSSTGFSVVWVEFDWSTPIKDARQTVTERLPSLTSELPPNAGTPTLGPPSSILGEILIVGLTSDNLSPGALRSVADRTIRPRLLAISGVSSVAVIGGEVEEYAITLSPAKMKHMGITLNEVIDALEGFNANASGGVVYDYDNEYLLKATLSTSDITEMEATPIGNTQSGMPITLADIANIEMAAKTPEIGKAALNSESAVLITVTKQPGIGSISLTDRILEELQTIYPTLPHGVNMNTEIFRQADFISNSVSNLQVSLFEGALFVIIVLFIFLLNFRTTVISAIAIPMSVIITLLIINWLGFTVNTMTLGGIAIAIGSLVDDAIVDVENVYRRLRLNRRLPSSQSKPTEEVVFEASREVRMPILNSSLIIMASFTPLFFLSGMEGRMLVPLGISFIIALLASTVVALTLTPVLCLYLLGTPKMEKKLEKEPYITRHLGIFYKKLLGKTLRHPAPVFILSLILLAGACVVFPFLGHSFLPSFNEGSFTVNVSALPGISLELSDSIGHKAERLIREVPEVILTARKTGRAELDEHSLGSNVSEIEVPYKLSGRSKEAVMNDIRQRLHTLPGVNVEIGQPISHRIDAMLSGSEAQIAVKIFGSDLDRLYALGKEVGEAMTHVDGVVDVNIEQQIPRPQIDIKPRRELLAQYGITLPDFTRFVNVALAGLPVSQVNSGNLPYDITLRIPSESRNSIDMLSDLMIDSKSGPIPLSSVAEIVSSSGPSTVNRENVSRRLVVSSNVSGRDLGSAVKEIRENIAANVNLPEGYSIQYGGQFESEEAASRTLMLTSIGAVVLIFFLLYAEFQSVIQSILILINMPLAMIGGVMMLWITGSDLNIPAIIGFISLLGIATRNGMLLMSHYNHLVHEGIPLQERVIQGSVDRLNPILMTGLSSAMALVPLALRATSPGNEIQAPMALVILGGLITSTLLNIFILPVCYEILCRNGRIAEECNCHECKNHRN